MAGIKLTAQWVCMDGWNKPVMTFETKKKCNPAEIVLDIYKGLNASILINYV